MVARVVVVLVVACSVPARADGLVIGGGSPRAVGRAGVGTVGDDGGGALLVNPAAMARRDASRAQVGVAFVDDAVAWVHDADSPRARDQAGTTALPVVAAEGAIGEWIVGAAAITAAASDRALRRPGSIPPSGYGNAFEYRYAGLSGSARRDTVTVGVARRIGDAVAVGLAIAGSRVAVSESRRIWAGFAARDTIGDPAHDLEVGITASGLSPSAVAGILVAPPDTRVELGASIGWAGTAHVSGDVAASGTSAVTVELASPTAALDVRQPLTLRTGARWLDRRWIAEADGDLWIVPAAAETTAWQLGGVTVVDASGARAGVPTLPSRISTRTHGAIRGAVDFELYAGFLWVTAGYAYTTAGTSSSRLSPSFGELAGHTTALGLEVTAGGFTVTLGWARTWSVDRTEPTSLWRLDNPFGAGDAMVPSGTYGASIDLVGISIDGELHAP